MQKIILFFLLVCTNFAIEASRKTSTATPQTLLAQVWLFKQSDSFDIRVSFENGAHKNLNVCQFNRSKQPIIALIKQSDEQFFFDEDMNHCTPELMEDFNAIKSQTLKKYADQKLDIKTFALFRAFDKEKIELINAT